MASRPPIKIEGDARDFIDFFGKTSTLDKKLKASLRKQIKVAGDELAKKSKAEVMKSSLHRENATESEHGPRPRSRGLRADIARGIGTTLKASEGAKVGVFITASPKSLSAERKRLLKLYNRQKGWRHPVFKTAKRISRAKGNQGTLRAMGQPGLAKHQLTIARNLGKWSHQTGRPYFGKVIEANGDIVAQAAQRALAQARKSAGL